MKEDLSYPPISEILDSTRKIQQMKELSKCPKLVWMNSKIKVSIFFLIPRILSHLANCIGWHRNLILLTFFGSLVWKHQFLGRRGRWQIGRREEEFCVFLSASLISAVGGGGGDDNNNGRKVKRKIVISEKNVFFSNECLKRNTKGTKCSSSS